MKRPALFEKEVPWWNTKLDTLRAQTRKFLNWAKVTGVWNSYRVALTTYNAELMLLNWVQLYCFTKSYQTALDFLPRSNETPRTREKHCVYYYKTHFPNSPNIRDHEYSHELEETFPRMWTKACLERYSLMGYQII